MKNVTCPKCSQNTVYTSKAGITCHGGALYVQNLKSVFVTPLTEYTSYVCTSCGYFETYINDEDKLSQITSKWSKV